MGVHRIGDIGSVHFSARSGDRSVARGRRSRLRGCGRPLDSAFVKAAALRGRLPRGRRWRGPGRSSRGRSTACSPPAPRPTWTGSRTQRDQRLDPSRVLPGARSVIAVALSHADPEGTAARAGLRGGRPLRARPRLPHGGEAPARGPGRGGSRSATPGAAFLPACDVAPGDGEGLGPAGRDRLGGEERLPHHASPRELGGPGDRPHRPRARARRAVRGALRRLLPLPARLPDRRDPGAGAGGRAALHLLLDHRAARGDPAGRRREAGRMGLRLRRLPDRLPLEPRPAGRRRRRRRAGGSPGAARARSSAACWGSPSRSTGGASTAPRWPAPGTTASSGTVACWRGA